MRKMVLLLLCFSGIVVARAQDKVNIKFGKILPADFTVSSPLIDSNVNAVVLSDIGSSEFIGNEKGWFSLVFKRHKRIKILNTKGFNAADISVLLYSNGSDAEKLEGLSANTYNLENGAIVTTRLENKDVFTDRIKRNLIEKKFTFPAVKAGSIVEYSYTIKSDFIFNLQPWEFQGEYPCLWSEYTVGLPDFFNYVFLSQGYLSFDINKKEDHARGFVVRQSDAGLAPRTFNISSVVTDSRWVIKNVPPLKAESFTSTINNHIAKIEFQLSEYRFPGEPVEPVMGNWAKVSEKLLAREDFGVFDRSNGWLDDDLKIIVKNTKSSEEKTRRIFEYVRDNFTCTSTYGTSLQDKVTLKEIFRRKSGSVSEINLLLLAMLRHESILSEPVLMSLRNRGLVHPIYPLMDRFNYLICEVNLVDRYVYLDASKRILGFGKLPALCYNGVAWVISKDNPTPIHLVPDSLNEHKQISIIIINNEKNEIEGSISSVLGDYESYDLREKMSKIKNDAYLKEIAKEVGGDIKLENLEIDSLKVYDEPVTVRYDFKMNNSDDIIYFNPLMGQEIKQNPFKSAQRLYPVEMPFSSKEMVILNMEIPKGYAVEEIPKSVRYKLNEDEGMFEYIVQKDTDKIMLRTSISINKATFSQEDYQPLRDFFSFIIKKQSEQIVFKKIK
jgi:hypothetical protein